MKMKEEKLKYFIDNNDIDLTGTGSNFNGNAVNFIGYSLYLRIEIYSTFEDILTKLGIKNFDDVKMYEIFKFAAHKNYGDWWKNENNRKKFNTLG